jgi:hypothetical protein
VLLALIVTLPWAGWMLQPVRPIRAWSTPFGTDDVSSLSPDGAYLLTACDTSRGWDDSVPFWQFDVWDAATVQGLAPGEFYRHQLIAGGRLLVSNNADVISVRSRFDGRTHLTTPHGLLAPTVG